ncbi:MAG: cardiolipin synthase [Clostridiales bacterium]|nr:cardiolipin synthase [Candidatus Cacconaster stercorequi]
MKKIYMEQRTERRISAALRLGLVAVLLVVQIVLVVVLSNLLHQYMAAAYVVLELVAIVYALRIYNRPGCSTYKPSWILLILAVPVVGLILYWLWNGDEPKKRLTLRKLPMPKLTAEERTQSQRNVEKLAQKTPNAARIASYLDRQGFALYNRSDTVYFSTGEAYLQDMLEKMRQAEHFIFMEYFILANGAIWQEMMAIFREKVKIGVEIKIIYDDFGSMMRMQPEQIMQLREMGAEVKAFNPVHHYVNRLYFNYRDHRKITAIDGNIAYTGGANIADEYANLITRFGYWKDCGVRLTGEGVWGLTREFLYQWERLGGEMHSEWDYYRPDDCATQSGFCQSFVDGPDNNPVSTAEEVFLQLISLAKKEVYITTPYLAIGEPMIKALCVAGDSGVDVRLMMPGVPDHKLAYMVAECYFGELLSHGVKIFSYEPGILHGKSVMVDGEAAFIGSVNMDYRSFQLHFECGTMLYGMPAIEDLRRDMDDIVAHSHEMTHGEWAHRAWYRRLIGPVLKLFAMWI